MTPRDHRRLMESTGLRRSAQASPVLTFRCKGCRRDITTTGRKRIDGAWRCRECVK